MREQDFVLLAYLPITLVLYVLLAARDLPTLTGRRASASADSALQRALPERGPVSRSSRIGRYVGWTTFAQVVPLLVALSNSPTAIRAACATEVLAAIAWTAYLMRSPSRDIPER